MFIPNADLNMLFIIWDPAMKYLHSEGQVNRRHISSFRDLLAVEGGPLS